MGQALIAYPFIVSAHSQYCPFRPCKLSLPRTDPPNPTSYACGDPDFCRWAHAILDSRRIWWGGEGNLVPMLDLINCAEGPDPKRVHSTWLDPSGQHAVTKAAWGFREGEQLFEPYGQPNHIYLAYHGFILDHNTHDCVKLDLRLSDSGGNYDEKVRALSRMGMRAEQNFCVSPRKIENRLLDFVGISFGVESRKEQRSTLKQELESRLSRYPTTTAEDEQALSASSENAMSYNRRVALRFRLKEKYLLRDVISMLGDQERSEL